MSRPFSVTLNVVSQSNGSCLLESGSTKVICAVYGPRARRPSPGQKQEFTGSGVLEVDASYAPFSSLEDQDPDVLAKKSERLCLALQTTLEASVQLYRFPKSALDIYLMVLEDDGSVIANSITCASLALACAGVEMYDLVSSTSLAKLAARAGSGGGWTVNPTLEEQLRAEALVTLSIMPSRQLIAGFDTSGPMDSSDIGASMELALAQCATLGQAMRTWLIEGFS